MRLKAALDSIPLEDFANHGDHQNPGTAVRRENDDLTPRLDSCAGI